MPWTRKILSVPPDENQLNAWEKEGFTRLDILGPCPMRNPQTGVEGHVYCVYLWRSLLAAPPHLTAAMPGRRN